VSRYIAAVSSLVEELKVRLGAGFEMAIPRVYEDLKIKAEREIEESLRRYPKAMKMWKLLCADPEVNADWDIANFIAVGKLKYNDHGEVHAKIVAANALKMLDILLENNILPDIIKLHAGDEDDAHLVVLAAGLLHDIGNVVHREIHPLHSAYMAISILNRLLPKVYEHPEVMYEIRNHILHCIYAHSSKIKDLTIEAALVGISDGTDMTKGRGRMAFDIGNVDIHTVSALSIEDVVIERGTERPIRILIKMSNSAGIFQVQELLVPKIKGSPIEPYIEIIAHAEPLGSDKDERIVHRLIIKDGKLVPL